MTIHRIYNFLYTVKQKASGSLVKSLVLLLLSSQAIFGQNLPVVKRGERPIIDISTIPSEAYEPGRLLIKIKPEVHHSLSDDQIVAPKGEFVNTGIASLDELNNRFGISEYKPFFKDLYHDGFKANDFRKRHEAWGFHLWFELICSPETDIIDAIQHYQALNEIEIAEPLYKIELIGNQKPDSIYTYKSRVFNPTDWVPNDPQFNEQWHYHNTGQQGGTPDADIDLPEAWEIEKGNSNVIVAILDEGIQFDHPDLSGNMWQNESGSYGYNFVDNSSTIIPGSHGTHVAGTVGAITNNYTGVAGIAGGSGSGNGIRLMSCQIFTAESSGGFHLAPVWAADNGAAISQNSWGYTFANVYNQSSLDAIDYFNVNGGGTIMNGGITIFAAGNNNSSLNYYPAYYSGTMAVAATNNQDIKSYYSNYGSWVDISATGGETNSVTARGIYSTTTNSSYSFKQGTSMACPHVSGVAALILSYAHRNGASLYNDDIWNLLINNVDNIYIQNPALQGQLGSGRINAQFALSATNDFIGPRYAYHVINDIEGNNNGRINPYELIYLTVALQNNTGYIYTNINATISTNSSYITIIDNSQFFGTFNPGETIEIANAFSFQVANNIVGGHEIRFWIEATNGIEVCRSWFKVVAEAPNLTSGNLTIFDPEGNNNGNLDPSEEATIRIPILNAGQISSNPVNASLTTSSNYVTILSGTTSLGQIAAGDSAFADFTVIVSEDAPRGQIVTFLHTITSGYYSIEKQYSVIIKGYLPDTKWLSTSGYVYSLAVDGDYTYVGGSFSYIGPNTGSGVKFTSSDDKYDKLFPYINGSILTSVPDGEGGWYIGGEFTKAGIYDRINIAHIFSDGSVDANWNPNANGSVRTIVLGGSDVYVGGDFTIINGQNRNRIAKLNSTTGEVGSWNPDANATVSTIALSNEGYAFVGGTFTNIGGQNRNRIAKLNITTGEAETWNPDATGYSVPAVNTIALSDDGHIYVGGKFMSIGGVYRSSIAKLNGSGIAEAWNPGASNTVRKIVLSDDGYVYVVGDFTLIDNNSRWGMAKLNSSGNVESWNPNAGDGFVPRVNTIVLGNDGFVYVGGTFTSIGGQERKKIAKLNNTTGEAESWNPEANNPVHTIAIYGSAMFVGGEFSSVNGRSRFNIAKINSSGGIEAWNPSANGSVRTIALVGSDVYVGGDFTIISGQDKNKIAKLNSTTGEADTAWISNADNTVWTIALSGDGYVYAGGSFQNIGGQARSRIAKLNTITGAAESWNPGANGTVRNIAVSEEGYVYIGGDYSSIGSQTRLYLTKFSNATGLLQTWNPSPNSTVWTIAPSGSDVFVGGSFTSIGGQARNMLAKINSSGSAEAWNPGANNYVYTIALDGNDVYAGGRFTVAGGQARNYIAKLNNTTGAAESWNPNACERIWSIALSCGNVYIGGQFECIGGTSQSYLAKFNESPISVICPQDIEICCDAESFVLASAYPQGGVYSGTGVSYQSGQYIFTPTCDETGNFLIRYTYTEPVTGCSNSCDFTITVNNFPMVICPSDLMLCIDDDVLTLTGAWPLGGIYSGNGVSEGQFNPANAGIGTHEINYSYSDFNGCNNTCTFTITVSTLPVIDCPEDFTVCVNEPAFELSGATPAGGVYSGNGVSNNIFNPLTSGLGNHEVLYSYTSELGCTSICSFFIDVSLIQCFQTDIISIYPGWNLISFDVIPENNTPASIFSAIIGENKLVYVSGFQNQEGVFFDPYGPDFLNTLLNMNPGEGYWVKVSSPCTLIVEGTPIPPDFAINLKAGWNLIGYWLPDPIPPASAFQQLIDLGILVYVSGFQNQEGVFFDPNGPDFLNTLLFLKNSEGYWVKMSEDFSGFSYPNNN